MDVHAYAFLQVQGEVINPFGWKMYCGTQALPVLQMQSQDLEVVLLSLIECVSV